VIHRLSVRVYYEDVDLGGIVYHANHLRYFERGRTEALRAGGVDQGVLKAETGVVLVVSRLSIDYRAPARFDDLLTVETEAIENARASVLLAQRLLRDDAPLATAEVRVAAVDGAGRAVRLPPAVRAALGGQGADGH
jgi:acyl-CoA thioester hydrolase